MAMFLIGDRRFRGLTAFGSEYDIWGEIWMAVEEEYFWVVIFWEWVMMTEMS